MKKISKKQQDATVAENKPTRVVGLDLGDRHSHYCMLTITGEEVETGRIQATRAAMEKHFAGEPRMRIALNGHSFSVGKPVVEKLWTPGDRSQPAQDPHLDQKRKQE